MRRAVWMALASGAGVLAIAACGVGPRGPVTGNGGALHAVGRRSVQVWPDVPAPADNPLTQAKVELGFRLWFEPRLSGNDRMSCATCHHHTTGYSNGERHAAGIRGQRGNRNVPTILAAAGSQEQFWDGRADSLEAQALGPIENPIEMDARLPDVLRKLSEHRYYPQKFQEAFGSGVTAEGLAKAIASFERALRTKPSAYERYLAGDSGALTPQQVQGLRLFQSERTRCHTCHSGPDLTDRRYHNTGIPLDPQAPDLGRYLVTGRPVDQAAFKTPTLRNVARSAPYMHDGSLPTLAAVVEHYDRGGSAHPQRDPLLAPLGLSPEEKAALVSFLEAFSAEDNLRDLSRLPGIRNPRDPRDRPVLPADLN
ncbi:MAG: cytochrome c peroxidase [Candidatus Sericytochromatia bacterium]|nr:cytochrome c peroxidase [Candidatus Sericytochromatia bacterium]